jgi:hypothetical protein
LTADAALLRAGVPEGRESSDCLDFEDPEL